MKRILDICGKKLHVDVAADEQSRTHGLMHVKALGTNDGMLFVMDSSGPASFWMKNTYIPLDIAFLDENMRIIKIGVMEPHTGKCSCNAFVKYVIEANAGWFASAGIVQGDVVTFETGTQHVNNIARNDTVQKTVTSAGFAIVDFSQDVPTVLCLYNDWHMWGLPKGKVENEESTLATAYRETEEEAGLTQEDFAFTNGRARPIVYKSGNQLKTVFYYFAERISDTQPWLPVNPDIGKPEHIAWKWIKLSALSKYLPRSMQPVIDDLEAWCYATSGVSTMTQE